MEDPAERESWLTYVFVGAGYAGLEGLAELQDFAKDVIELYPRCRAHGMRWILVEAKERVMTEIEPDLANFASLELRGRGIEIRTNTTLDRVTASEAHLSGGEVVLTRTVVWTTGVKPHPVVGNLGLPTDDGGRIVTERTLRVQGRRDVWAIGDNASVPDPAKDYKANCPPTAQHAIRQGRLVGRNISAALGTGTVRPFTYKTKGVFVDLGQGDAVASTMGIKWRGRPAWLLARSYHLAMMPGLKRKARLLTDWNVQLAFGRDASELGRLGHPPQLDEPTGGGVPSGPQADGADPADAVAAARGSG
jgi:NADH dehydrogenase